MIYCQNEPVPSMHVGRAAGQPRLNYFLARKLSVLSGVLGKPEIVAHWYAVKEFQDLIKLILADGDGIKIYFASYSKEGKPEVPPGLGESMTFVFSPTKSRSEVGKFYILNPGQAPKRIDESLASEWVKNYQVKKLPELNRVIAKPDGDTLSIYYDGKPWEELSNEMTCQPASGIRAYLSSFTDNESGATKQYEKQMILQFLLTEFKDGAHRDFFIEDRPGFDLRPKRAPGFLDTGSPCPPAVCGNILPSS